MLEKTLADTITATRLAGFDRIFQRLPPPPEQTDVSDFPDDPDNIHLEYVDRAKRALLARNAVTRDQWGRLESSAKREAFTVSNLMTESAIERVQNAIAEDIEAGGTLREFRQKMLESLDTSALSPRHIENIYRTNIGTNYEKAKEEAVNLPLVRDEFPFVLDASINDSRRTELCETVSKSGIDGTNIFLRDDPEWQRLKPLRHWQCRCATVFLSVEDAAKRGIKYAQKWMETGQKPPNPPYVKINAELPKGWVR